DRLDSIAEAAGVRLRQRFQIEFGGRVKWPAQARDWWRYTLPGTGNPVAAPEGDGVGLVGALYKAAGDPVRSRCGGRRVDGRCVLGRKKTCAGIRTPRKLPPNEPAAKAAHRSGLEAAEGSAADQNRSALESLDHASPARTRIDNNVGEVEWTTKGAVAGV